MQPLQTLAPDNIPRSNSYKKIVENFIGFRNHSMKIQWSEFWMLQVSSSNDAVEFMLQD